jgi:hypothetical protein
MIWGLSTDKPAATHFNNDGRTDITVLRDGTWHSYSSTLGWLQLNMGSGAADDRPMLGNYDDYGINIEDLAIRGLRDGVVKWLIVQGGSNSGGPAGSPSTSQVVDEQLSDMPVVGDFNGDSRDEIGYFRDGLWVTSDYRGHQPTAMFQWGTAGDIPVPGDYDGDRQTDHAIFRPSTGEWWVNQSTNGVFVLHFGQSGDIPVPADYDGDGKVDIAIYRNGVWWQFLSATQSVQVVNWGLAGDIPIPAQSLN